MKRYSFKSVTKKRHKRDKRGKNVGMTCILTNHAMSNYIDTPRQCEATFFFQMWEAVYVTKILIHTSQIGEKSLITPSPSSKIEYTFVFE